MKKLLLILCVISLFGCKEENTAPVLNCKLAKTVTVYNSYTDTTVYSYSGDDYTSVTKYTSSAVVYTRKYKKSGAQYLIEFYSDAVKTHEGFGTLNGLGKFDTSRITNLNTMLFNNRDKGYYDASGNKTRYRTDYNTYINDVKYHYSGGNYSYWIYDVYHPLAPLTDTKDSVVFEYYLDKPKVAEKFAMESRYGNLEKNLVKKRFTYDLLNAATLKSTIDYEYLTDADGLITREIVTARNQPANTVSYTYTIYYEYFCD